MKLVTVVLGTENRIRNLLQAIVSPLFCRLNAQLVNAFSGSLGSTGNMYGGGVTPAALAAFAAAYDSMNQMHGGHSPSHSGSVAQGKLQDPSTGD